MSAAVPEEISIWIGGLSKANWPPNVDGHHPLSNWIKQEDRGRLALPSLCLTTQLRHQASPVLTAPGSQEIWIRSYTISLLALRPSTYTTSLPEPPACRWQTVDLLSLHNHMSQYLRMYMCVCVCVCMHSLSCFSRVWLCNTMDCSPPGSSCQGISQARILEWVAISYSRGSSWPRDWTCISGVSCLDKQMLFRYAAWEANTLA